MPMMIDTKSPLDPPTIAAIHRRHRVGAVVAQAVVAVLVVVLAFYLWLVLRPYTSVAVPGFPEDGYALTFDRGRTPEGLPILYYGDNIRYETELCNDGVDVRFFRYLDQYGRQVGTANGDPDERQFTLLEETGEVWRSGDDPFCTGPFEADFSLDGIESPGVYRFRTDNIYDPNFATSRTVTTFTERFVLMAPPTDAG